MDTLKNAFKYFVVGFVITYVLTFSVLSAIPRGHDFDPPLPDNDKPLAVVLYDAEMDAREKTHPLAVAMIALFAASLVGVGCAVWAHEKTKRV